MSAILAMLLPAVLPAVASLVTAGIGFLTLTIQKKIKADTAWRRLAEVGGSLAGRAWDALGPTMQMALADGKITSDERKTIERVALGILTANDRVVLDAIAKEVNIPFEGILVKLADDFIDTWAAAHDPANAEVSRLAYPVDESLAIPSGGG